MEKALGGSSLTSAALLLGWFPRTFGDSKGSELLGSGRMNAYSQIEGRFCSSRSDRESGVSDGDGNGES